MTPRFVRHTLAGAALSLSCSLGWAFSEDICYHYQSPQNTAGPINPAPFNCWDLQCRDGALAQVPASAATCVVTGLARYADASLRGGYHVRNSIHFDVTWLAARLQGMSAADASRLAVFAEATDLGGFQHYDYLGQPIVGTAADNILGVQRTNTKTSGFWLHFVPWRQPAGSTQTSSELTYTDGSGTSSPYPAQEVPLAHLRAWAFGQQPQLCEFGMTDSGGPIGNCLTQTGKKLFVDLPLLADPADLVDIRLRQSNPLEWQRIHPQTSECNARDCYDESYGTQKAGSLEALGVYLHALADRLSHDHCSDDSYIADHWAGPDSPTQTAEHYLFYPDICGTMAHATLHYAETGQPLLPERSRSAIRYAYQEIGAWMNANRYARDTVSAARGYPEPTSTEAVATLIDRALTQGTAAERLGALCDVGRRGYSLAWHDNNATCVYSSDLNMTQSGSIAGITNGRPRSFSLSVVVRPPQGDSGQSGDSVVMFKTPDQRWYSYTANGAAPYRGDGAPAVYRSGAFEPTTLPLLNGEADLSAFRDTEIYFGFGTSLGDIVQRQRYAKVGVVK